MAPPEALDVGDDDLSETVRRLNVSNDLQRKHLAERHELLRKLWGAQLPDPGPLDNVTPLFRSIDLKAVDRENASRAMAIEAARRAGGGQ